MENELEDLKKNYNKWRKVRLSLGVLFLLSATCFTIYALLTKDYDVLSGVLLQVVGGMMLICVNLKE